MPYQAVVFDLDGTLLYTLEDLYLATNHALEAMGLPARSREEVRSYVGNGYRQLFRLAVPQGTSDEVQEQALAIFNSYYLEHDEDHTAPYPGIRELLRALKDRGLRLAVATSKPEVFSLRILERFELREFFDDVVGCGLDGSLDTKAEVVAEALRRLGVTDKSRAVMVGDRRYDVLGAGEAGIKTIGAGWGYAEEGELEAAGALWIAKKPEDLLA